MAKNKFAGIHIDDNKLSKDVAITRLDAPKVVYIPLSQHIGKHASSIVKVGDSVLKGQLIAQSPNPDDLSAKIFSSVSGIVSGINIKRPATSGIANHIQIENDFKYEQFVLPKLIDPSIEEIIDRVYESGIVGMGGAGFPTHIKLKVGDEIDTLIVNGIECEPYITCDYRLMLEYTQEMLQGILLIAKCVKASTVLLCIKQNTSLANHLNQAIVSNSQYNNIVVKQLQSIYPLGSEKQLIYAATGRKVPALGLPKAVGVVVSNVATSYSVYNAVVNGITSYERLVTVTGRCVNKPCNVWVSNGTPIEHLLDYAEIDPNIVVKIVIGGPMMGTALDNTQISTTKIINCILALTKLETSYSVPSECINCSLCAKTCPMKLMPMFIVKYGNVDDASNSAKYGAKDCIECGCCSFVCPAKIPLVAEIRNAKKVVAKAEKKKKV
ncbi:MAG: electron transport complex subunit RsxC [Firmicutes bacterium]|nr:electron transport complex subunit RsxC [Bacillota bacterium]MCL1953304.1 electron transport complex subunit RsxC [Bacillota bacterium]